MENLKYYIQKNKIFILILLFCVLFTSIFTIIKFDVSSSNKSENVFNSIVDDINKSNSSLDYCIKDSTIDTATTTKTLVNNINELSQLKNTLSATIVSNDSDRTILPMLISTIDSTQALYNYCLDTLTTEEKPDFNEVISQFTTLKNNCINNYEEASNLSLNIVFSKSTLEFFDNFLNYLRTLDSLTKHQKIKDSQTNDFFKSFNIAITDFSNLLEDIEPAVDKIRSDNRSLDILIDDITQKEMDFIMIKRNLSYISIPESCMKYYNSLNDTFNIYSTYLTTIKTALIFEKSSTSYDSKKDIIDKNYSNAYSKYIDVKDSLDILTKSLENF